MQGIEDRRPKFTSSLTYASPSIDDDALYSDGKGFL